MFTERQNLLLSLLREQGRSTGDTLAATLGVSKRTVYRDLGTLIERGVPIRTEGGPGGGIWIDETAQVSAEQQHPASAVADEADETIEEAIARYERSLQAESQEEAAQEEVAEAFLDEEEDEPVAVAVNETAAWAQEESHGAAVHAEAPEVAASEPASEHVAERAEDSVAHWFDQAFGKRTVSVPVVVQQEQPADDEEIEPEAPVAAISSVPAAAAYTPAPEAVPSATPAAAQPASVNLATVVRERIFLDASGWWQEEMPSQMVVDLLQEAIFTNRMMRVQFHVTPGSDNFAGLGATTRVIEPYGLVAKGGVWYLVSRQGTHFVADRLSRIASAEQLSGRFERAAGFDLETWWSHSGDQFARGNEQYRFTALVRRNRVEFLRMYVGGRLQVDTVDAQWARARLEVASPEAAVMIVLGLGQDAVVIEPDELPLYVRRAAAGRPMYEATVAHRPTPSYALG